MIRVLACVCLLISLTGCVTFAPPSTGLLCPFSTRSPGPPPSVPPDLIGRHSGDRDFSGHGPNIFIEVQLCISSDGRNCIASGGTGTRIIAVIDYLAQETNPDGSVAGDGSTIRQRFVRPVFPASALARATAPIASIDSPTNSTIAARSAPAGFEVAHCNDGRPIDPASIRITGGAVASVSLIGDTGAEDISNDPDCHCDTRVNDIVFNDVEFTLAEEPPVPEPVVPVEWRAGAWGACVDNMQTRSVSCVESGTGTMVPDMRCTSPRPRDTQPCGGYCSGSTSSDRGVSGMIALCMYESSGGPRIDGCIPTYCDGDTLHQWTCHYDASAGGMVIDDTTIPLPCGAAFVGGRCTSYTADDGQRGSACVAP